MHWILDARPLLDPAGGGIPRVARGILPALAQTLHARGHRATLLGTGFRRPTHPLLQTVPYQHLRIPNILHSLSLACGITAYGDWPRASTPDALFFPNLGFMGQPRVPYAVLVHDLSFLIEPRWFSQKSRLWHWAIRATRQLQNATWLFAVSEHTKRDLERLLGIPETRIHVIPLGIDPLSTEPAPLPAAVQGKRFLLALGAHDPRKNARCAVTAWRELCRDPRVADVELVLCGSTNALPRELCESGARHPLYLARPSDAQLATLYQNASAFLYPSWYEGFGIPLHEAAQAGTPCLASDTGALPETAPTGTRFAPPMKPHLWRALLEDVLLRPNLHATRSETRGWNAAAETIANVFLK